jgi:nucleoside-diphosphate-sugar epimerase
MNILVSGASGFFGNNFITFASKKRHNIYAISRYKQKKIKNVKWIIGHLDKNYKEFKKCEVLIHFAAAGVDNRNLSYKKAFETNVIKSSKFLINAAKSGCLRWVIIGSSSEYGKTLKLGKPININSPRLPVCNYGKTKSVFSDLVKILSKIFESKCLVMRTFPVYGLNENKKRLVPSLLQAIKDKKNFTINNSMEIRDFSNINDIVKKILKAARFSKKINKSCEEWHLASGKALKVGDFVKSMCINKNYKQKLIYKKKKLNLFHHISDKKSIW